MRVVTSLNSKLASVPRRIKLNHKQFSVEYRVRLSSQIIPTSRWATQCSIGNVRSFQKPRKGEKEGSYHL